MRPPATILILVALTLTAAIERPPLNSGNYKRLDFQPGYSQAEVKAMNGGDRVHQTVLYKNPKCTGGLKGDVDYDIPANYVQLGKPQLKSVKSSCTGTITCSGVPITCVIQSTLGKFDQTTRTRIAIQSLPKIFGGAFDKVARGRKASLESQTANNAFRVVSVNGSADHPTLVVEPSDTAPADCISADDKVGLSRAVAGKTICFGP